jgi:hypothetical protein
MATKKRTKKSIQFVVYTADDEVIVTTPTKEKQTLRDWFTYGDRDVERYDSIEFDTGTSALVITFRSVVQGG